MAVQFWNNRGAQYVLRSGRSATPIMATPPARWRCPIRKETFTRLFAACCRSRSSSISLSAKTAQPLLEAAVARHAENLAAIIVEPLVQGAGGMHFHDAAVLQTIRAAADRHDVLLIFDEIFTGFGRTGALFAFQEAGVTPDILTLSKALTGGTLPLAATIARRKIFEAFWSDDPAKALMHGPTFMANPLACAAANASLDLFEREPRLDQVAEISRQLAAGLEPCRAFPGVKDVRVKGAVGVVELDRIDDLNTLRERFVAEGVFIRPFGNVVYLTPSFSIRPDGFRQADRAAIVKVFGSRV